MIIDLCKMGKITPKGCHALKSCHPFGIWDSDAIFFYNPIIPSGLQNV